MWNTIPRPRVVALFHHVVPAAARNRIDRTRVATWHGSCTTRAGGRYEKGTADVGNCSDVAGADERVGRRWRSSGGTPLLRWLVPPILGAVLGSQLLRHGLRLL